jgi:FdhD protein
MNKRTLFCIGEIMYINEQYHDLPLLETKEYRFISRDGQLISKQEQILKEHLIDVYLNDHLTMKLVCLPQYLTELVLGRLLTERIIDSISDIEQIYICEYGKRAKVYLNRTSKTLPQNIENNLFIEITPTCCTGNHILNDYFVSGQTPKTVPSINWKPDWIFQMADAFADGMPLHSTTFATHSCLLARNGQILFSCEDIGRHNALDKAIGYALRNQIDLRECIVYSSGRIPTDMAMKAIYAQIPILASKASPTVEAIELAKEYHLTLICAARRDRMKVFS